MTPVSIPTPPSAPEPSTWQSRAPAASAGAPRRAQGAGPLALLLPIFALLAFTLWRQVGSGAMVGRPTSTERPPSARGERVVDGWAGSFTFPGTAPFVVEARLTPLHAVPERQAFDAAALARRLGLPHGEPWRLALTARTDVGGQVASSDLGASSEPGPSSEPGDRRLEPLPLAALALTGFQALAERADGARHDPLRTLLAAPSGGLAPGQRVDMLFWRPLPAGAAAGGAGEATACMLSVASGDASLEVVLTPTRLAEPDTSASLARLPKSLREEGGR